MKYIALFALIYIFFSCSQSVQKSETVENDTQRTEVIRPDFRQILDSANVDGSVLVFDPQTNTAYSNDFNRCEVGFLPASTFKIPNSIIALETGLVEDDSTLFKWNGEKRRLPVWEQDLILRDAFQLSCVPCYQEIARKIGVERMKEYLAKLNYRNMVVDSATIDLFWLEGESAITMNQQLDFLIRFYKCELPITERTHQIMKRLMLLESNDSWSFSGKTGWVIRNGNNIGWFVGYLEKGNYVYFIVLNIEPNESFNMDFFPKIRAQISLGAFKKLKIID
jgi:beta-lactamase class D